jgi:dolichol-phosphate mannosyltransferase
MAGVECAWTSRSEALRDGMQPDPNRPPFQVSRLMKHWIVIPTYNERENIAPLLREMFLVVPQAGVIVVDDKSPDGTAEVVRTLQAKYANLNLYVRSGKLGLGSAYLEAFQKLQAAGDFDTVTTMDADFSHSPRYLPKMLELAREHDLVIGSRYVNGGGTKGWSAGRRLLSASGNLYARLVTGVSVNDLTAGFVTFRRTALEKILSQQIHSSGYAYTIESKCLAIFAGAHAKEIPIVFEERHSGRSKLSLRIIMEAFIAPWYSRFARSALEQD